ncbi:rod shape-determining protein MreD [Roseomonas sp. CCTCC AB2023176]|uniref:rod shape-determining protein MreD n=1 Tax=Roseomonas sp. CCTCC AB2023176 TaxID=3342640 RepID=UPI0035D6FD0F
MAVQGRPEPAPGLLRRLDEAARAALPATSTAILLLAAGALPGMPSLMPAIALASVFFWTIFRPAAMSAPVVFLLGLLQDLLGFGPLGAAVLVLLLAHAGTLRVRRSLAKQSFLVVWIAYLGVAAAAVAMGFALHALLAWRLPPPTMAATQMALTAGLYPLLAYPFSRAHRAMQRAEAMA